MILKNLIIQSSSFYLTDFLKLRNFYYVLVLLNRRPHNPKNKTVAEISLVPPRPMFPLKCSLPPPLKAKKVTPPQAAVFEKFLPSLQKGKLFSVPINSKNK